MGTYKTNWQLTETVMPEDMNRIEGNIKGNDDELVKLKESTKKSFEARDKEISKKAPKEDVILKVPIPEDRDCNSFKTPNAFCTYDTGIGDLKNTPEGILNQGTSRVFMIINKAFSSTRIQQEFINLFPQNRVTRYIRNFNEEGWGNWYKVYDEANKPTPNDIGAVNKNGDKVTGTLKFESNGNEIELVNPSTGLQARGIVFKDNYVNNNLIGMIGAYMNNKEMLKTFMGTTATPWDGRNSFTVDRQGCYFNNQKIYHTGNKPTTDEIGAWNKAAKRLEGADFNIVTEGGIYATVKNTIEKHAPLARDGRLIVMSWNSGNWASQMFFADGGRIFTRTATNIQGTEWIDWTELYTRQSKPTPQDIGAQPKGATVFEKQEDYVAVRTEGRKENQYYEFWDKIGWADIKCRELYVGNGVNKVYHAGNKPTPQDIGAFGNMSRVEIGTDLNTLVNSGTYEVNQITSSANHPSGTPYGWGVLNVYNTKGPAKRVLQIYYPHINGTIPYIRMKDGDTWQAWKKVTEGLTPEEIGAVANSNVSQGVDVNTIVQRDNAGDIYARLLRATYQDEATISGAIAYRVNNSTDNYTRYCSNPVAVREWLGALGKTEKAVSCGNADTVSGKNFVWDWGTGNPTHIWGSSGSATQMKVWSPDSITVGKSKVADSVPWAGVTNKPTPADIGAVKIADTTPFWKGGWVFTSGHKVKLPKNISDTPNGLILIWSAYTGGVIRDYNYCVTIVPKYKYLYGKSVVLTMTNTVGKGMYKVIYVVDNGMAIQGKDENESGDNVSMVLREIYEY